MTTTTTQDDVLYVSGNKLKLSDLKKVLGNDISTFATTIKEIQGLPIDVSLDKISRIYTEQGGRAVGCEDTTFGSGELASYIKQVTEECERNEGDLYSALRAIAPKRQYFDYTSIFSFKDETHEAMFECKMKCEICPRTATGMIDPFAIPIEYDLIMRVNGKTTILCANQPIENPGKLSIAQQTDIRHLVHPRYFSVGAYNNWRRETYK